MSYIPPHLRISDGNKSKPSPAAPPSGSSGRTTTDGRGSKETLPAVTINWSIGSTTTFIVLHHHEHLSVEFAKFEGETFAHLKPHQLYTLTDSDPGQQNATENVEGMPRLSLQESRHSANVIFTALQEELKKVTKRFEEFVHSRSHDTPVPLMWLRLGKLLFHAGRGVYDWKSSYTPEDVERGVKTRKLSKTFDNCLSKEEFMFLHEVAHKDALHSSSKERIIIEVADEMRPGVNLLCVCSILDVNEQSLNPGERLQALETTNPAKCVLVLKRIRLRVVRHMVGDVACIGKSRDIRLLFYTKETITELSEEELCDLKSTFSKASVNSTAKGGLQWPLGSRHSTSGRFHVLASSHEKLTLVVSGGVTWRLQTCNRVEFKASTGRLSYEVALRPIVYYEFCKGREDRTTEELLQSIEDLLQWVWLECI